MSASPRGGQTAHRTTVTSHHEPPYRTAAAKVCRDTAGGMTAHMVRGERDLRRGFADIGSSRHRVID
jgi:hypothetical protein